MQRLWVDLTTSRQDAGRPPHGTLRVERGIVAALAERADPAIGFVAFDPGHDRFTAIPAGEALRIATAPIRSERGRELASVWRRRAWAMQARLSRLLRPPPAPRARQPEPFGPGDVLLLPGEHDRHDFAHLAGLKRTRRLALAFVFYDLLRVLADDDPMLLSEDPNQLPQSDFMAREAALILPISQFSAAIMRKHLTRRGWASCPVAPIRLAGKLPVPVPAPVPATAVPGLVPGRFVLSVGDVVARKNHRLLVHVWAALAAKAAQLPTLVIVGRIDLEGNDLVRSVRRDPALRALIRFLPNLDDAALLWLYHNCRYTVFPSHNEGFGLPVAESLSHGKPCLASSAAAIPEAGQGVALTLAPADQAAWEREVARLQDDAVLAGETARVARLFRPVTWSDTAVDILAAIAQHLPARPG